MRFLSVATLAVLSLGLCGCEKSTPFASPEVISKYPAEYARAEAQVVASAESARFIAIVAALVGAVVLAAGVYASRRTSSDLVLIPIFVGGMVVFGGVMVAGINHGQATAPMVRAVRAMHGGETR